MLDNNDNAFFFSDCVLLKKEQINKSTTEGVKTEGVVIYVTHLRNVPFWGKVFIQKLQKSLL